MVKKTKSLGARIAAGCALGVSIVVALVAARGVAAAEPTGDPTDDIVITNADIMTVSHGTIENGSLWIRNGKIAGVGATVAAPRDARIIDAGGRFVTPGIIDAHSHIGMDAYSPAGVLFDANEYVGKPGGMAGPNQADLRIRDSIRSDASSFYILLSSGLTAGLELPGSANLFGGQAAPVKLKVGRPRADFFIEGAPVSMKIACSGTPFRAWKGRAGFEKQEDIAVARRRIYDEAKAYMARQEAYEKAAAAGRSDGPPPPVDLKMEAIAGVLRGDTLLQMHCHEASSMLEELAVARDYGITIRTVHHGSEAYQVARELVAAGTGVLGIADVFGGGAGPNHAIPWNIPILKQAGARVALHGEANSLARRLTQEAGKMLRYGRGAFTRDEALALVTLNAAWTMGLDHRMGSIDVGKDADVVIWEADPLSSYGHAEKVFIDGELFFDATRPGLGLTQVEQGS